MFIKTVAVFLLFASLSFQEDLSQKTIFLDRCSPGNGDATACGALGGCGYCQNNLRCNSNEAGGYPGGIPDREAFWVDPCGEGVCRGRTTAACYDGAGWPPCNVYSRACAEGGTADVCASSIYQANMGLCPPSHYCAIGNGQPATCALSAAQGCVYDEVTQLCGYGSDILTAQEFLVFRNYTTPDWLPSSAAEVVMTSEDEVPMTSEEEVPMTSEEEVPMTSEEEVPPMTSEEEVPPMTSALPKTSALPMTSALPKTSVVAGTVKTSVAAGTVKTSVAAGTVRTSAVVAAQTTDEDAAANMGSSLTLHWISMVVALMIAYFA